MRLERTFSTRSSVWIHTYGIAAFWIAIAWSFVIAFPASARISPVDVSTMSSDGICPTIEECKERDATYAAPLKVKVRLCNKDKDEINEHEIFMGDLPLMTDTGSFVINGAERVIVSQLVRSPGIYYGIDHDKIGKELYSCTVIPNRGAWLEYETDTNDVFYVRVDRTRKVPVTVLIRALGYGTNAEIIDLFGTEPLRNRTGLPLHSSMRTVTLSTTMYPVVSVRRLPPSRRDRST